MRRFIIAAALAATVMPSIPAMAQQGWSQHDRREQRRDDRADRRDDRQDRRAERRDDRRDARRDAWRNYSRYDYNRPDPRYGNRYDAARYYRNDASYRERRLTRNDRIYRGNDGRYYCRREDGTTGLIIGAAGGALLGRELDGGYNRATGTILGAALGGLLGREIDRGRARCR